MSIAEYHCLHFGTSLAFSILKTFFNNFKLNKEGWKEEKRPKLYFRHKLLRILEFHGHSQEITVLHFVPDLEKQFASYASVGESNLEEVLLLRWHSRPFMDHYYYCCIHCCISYKMCVGLRRL